MLSHMRIYDNFRHIFFLLPALLIFGGFTFVFHLQTYEKVNFCFPSNRITYTGNNF
jgi:hypothetical protein